jgi:hypothetical protein
MRHHCHCHCHYLLRLVPSPLIQWIYLYLYLTVLENDPDAIVLAPTKLNRVLKNNHIMTLQMARDVLPQIQEIEADLRAQLAARE